MVDIQKPCIEELALLQAPVTALRRRLTQLLSEWPEHPVLLQLVAICGRLTGLSFSMHLLTSMHWLQNLHAGVGCL